MASPQVLRSMALSPGLEGELRDRARAAMESIDRPPVTDDAYLTRAVQPEGEGDESGEGDERDEGDGGDEGGEGDESDEGDGGDEGTVLS